MKAIIVVGLCDVMIIWIIATYIPSGIYLLRVGNDGACVVALGLQCIHHSDVIDVNRVSLLLTWGLFPILLGGPVVEFGYITCNFVKV